MSLKYSGIKIGLASSETVRKWSHGEVTKPETVNYKTIKPERDGLFCEKIFGPQKDYECSCGKYKKVKNKGKVCERCGVEITESIVRRERMGHIELASPVVHTWMLLKRERVISRLLNIKQKDLEKVVYFKSYIVLNEGKIKEWKNIKDKDIPSYKEVLDFSGEQNEIVIQSKKKILHILDYIKNNILKPTDEKELKSANRFFNLIFDASTSTFSVDEVARFINKHTGFELGIGPEAVEKLLKEFTPEKIAKEAKQLRAMISQGLKDATSSEGKSGKIDQTIIKRLKILNAFSNEEKDHDTDKRNKPEWMVLSAIPIIPPDLRPIIQLDGGRFTTSDLNNLYRKVIIRNQRLKHMKDLGAPSIIINNEKRLLQEAVDSLFDNAHLPKAKKMRGKDGRELKSLAALLEGKEGRFRQNLLGKRVDYSGRSVIVVGPELKLYQCGLPAEMALSLFKPFIISKMIERGIAGNVRMAEKAIEKQQDSRIFQVLNEVVKDRPVLLNRAPTLHRLGIQAFEPIIIDSKAIRLHPLVCAAFNADFDGDQMAVHVPLSKEAVAEARSIMLASWHILSPKDGQPIVTPGQDIVLGNYFVTMERKGARGQGHIFGSAAEVKIAFESAKLDVHALIAIDCAAYEKKGIHEEGYLITTVGKVLWNESFPENFPFINSNDQFDKNLLKSRIVKYGDDVRSIIEKTEVLDAVKKKDLSKIIKWLNDNYPVDIVAKTMDEIKNIGFKFSTKSGVTFSLFDVPTIENKQVQVQELEDYIVNVRDLFRRGKITQWERLRLINEKWEETRKYFNNQIKNIIEKDKSNPIVMMADSGARGNLSNFMQLSGLRGLMLNAKGETIEIPIKSSFLDGLTISEVFISTFGARKGMTDTALNTSRSGFLTRRFIDGSQEIIVNYDDCYTNVGLVAKAFIDQNNQEIETLKERILGRFSLHNIYSKNKELIIAANELITNDIADDIIANDVKNVEIRSPIHCLADKGICQKCYGIDLSTNEIVAMGTPAGIIASQSLGEPSTQLTMRTFHSGGVKSNSDISRGLEEVIKVFDAVVGLKDTSFEKYVVYLAKDLNAHKTNPQIYIDLFEFITKSLKSFTLIKNNREVQWSKFSYIFGKVKEVRRMVYNEELITNLYRKENGPKASNQKLEDIKMNVDEQLLNREFYEITIVNQHEEQRYYTFDCVVKEGQDVEPGTLLSKGRIIWELLIHVAGTNKTVDLLQGFAQRIYKLNGIDVCDKYMEIMIKKMVNYVTVINPAEGSNFVPGENISIQKFNEINNKLLLANKKPIYAVPTILGLFWTWENAKEKFFSAMSYIYTSLVLIDAAINERVDPMTGIKENVALGDLIPVGTFNKTKEEIIREGEIWHEKEY